MITLRANTRDHVFIPYDGTAPSSPEVALIPADFGEYPADPADWRPADYTDGRITFLLGADPHTYPVGTYAVLVRYTLGLARPEEWAGWIRLL